MQITGSSISMAATRTYTAQHRVSEQLRSWQGDQRPDFEGATRGPGRDLVEFSAPGQAALNNPEVICACEPTQSERLSSEDEAVIATLEKVLEQLTGKKIKLQRLHWSAGDSQQVQTALEKLQSLASGPANGRAGWGIEYDRTEDFAESEQTSFSTTGVVKTADGREINFAVNLNMSRSFVAHNEENLRMGDAVRKDPLVINLDGKGAELTTTKYSFDIDTDGTKDQISFVTSGSGFLALDKNSDGKINNGKELFGATTGNGFAELAQYDEDGNQWIDEGDAVYDKLRIWSKSGDGTDRLIALGQAGVGAIYLGHVATPFSLSDTNNEQLGVVKSTGIWLGEQGGAGTVQQLDLVV